MSGKPNGGSGPEGPARRRRVRGRIGGAVATLLLLLIIGSWIKLGTTSPIVTVETGSMVPTLHIGDIALMESLHGRPPKLGQIVVAPVPIDVQQHLGYPAFVTHRVVKIANGKLTTKGDANSSDDPFQVPLSKVHLRLVRVIPGAGRFERFMLSPFGILWLVFGAVVFLGPKLLDLVRDGMTPMPAASGDNTTLGELVLAVREYGDHLRSHTAVVQAMAEASQHLAAVTARLEAGTAAAAPPPPPVAPAPPPPVPLPPPALPAAPAVPAPPVPAPPGAPPWERRSGRTAPLPAPWERRSGPVSAVPLPWERRSDGRTALPPPWERRARPEVATPAAWVRRPRRSPEGGEAGRSG